VSETWPTIVLGGTGYVAGEMLRLIAGHPRLELGAAVSTSQAGEPLAAAFGHLARVYPNERFVSPAGIGGRLGEAPHWLVLSAAPHGASAEMVAQLLDAADGAGTKLSVVDASADFRFADAQAFAAVYGQPHARPERLGEFSCAVPEHLAQIQTPHAAHPGCFATAMLLAIVPLLASGSSSTEFYVSAVTGSTGAGRKTAETTHHPVRQSNLFAYKALEHRHSPEVRALAEAATGCGIELHFVPHSGPFARGIHATVFARRLGDAGRAELVEMLTEFYRASPFVHVLDEPPRMKDVVASNYASLSVAVDDDSIVVCSVLDNLVKGAAGGSLQWANRLLGLPEWTGLLSPAAGWL
jgi:N-acetyl-gamma-glutamyl-phosphate reductase common form